MAEAAVEPRAVPVERALAPLPLQLPKPVFKETPKNVPVGTHVEPPAKGPRAPFMAHEGASNLAQQQAVSGSDNDPIIGSLDLVTDGDKEAAEGSYVELGPGVQWVQIDLGQSRSIYAIMIWHYHGQPRVYHDVIVQVADDADFIEGVQMIYNNDHDNSAGQGIGQDLGYWETFEGKLIDAQGVRARHVRLYSNGSTSNEMNQYTEVEVWGLPE